MKHIKLFEEYNPLEDRNPFDAIRNDNDWADYTPEEKETKLKEIDKEKAKLLDRIESDRVAGKNLENWIIGYVINNGGEHGLTTQSVVFGQVFPTEKDNVSWVMSQFHDNSMVWLRYDNRDIKAGGCPECKEKAIKYHRQLEKIRNNN